MSFSSRVVVNLEADTDCLPLVNNLPPYIKRSQGMWPVILEIVPQGLTCGLRISNVTNNEYDKAIRHTTFVQNGLNLRWKDTMTNYRSLVTSPLSPQNCP